MNRRNIFTLFIVAGLLLLAAALRAPMPSAQAQEGPEATQVNVGTAFTYQGRLTNASGPVDGACDFRFELWTAASGGQQTGARSPLFLERNPAPSSLLWRPCYYKKLF